MKRHSFGVTGVIDSRLPFASTRMFASASCSRSAARGTSGDFLTKRTSTSTQRGASRVDFGSCYGLCESNCVGSG